MNKTRTKKNYRKFMYDIQNIDTSTDNVLIFHSVKQQGNDSQNEFFVINIKKNRQISHMFDCCNVKTYVTTIEINKDLITIFINIFKYCACAIILIKEEHIIIAYNIFLYNYLLQFFLLLCVQLYIINRYTTEWNTMYNTIVFWFDFEFNQSWRLFKYVVCVCACINARKYDQLSSWLYYSKYMNIKVAKLWVYEYLFSGWNGESMVVSFFQWMMCLFRKYKCIWIRIKILPENKARLINMLTHRYSNQGLHCSCES